MQWHKFAPWSCMELLIGWVRVKWSTVVVGKNAIIPIGTYAGGRVYSIIIYHYNSLCSLYTV